MPAGLDGARHRVQSEGRRRTICELAEYVVAACGEHPARMTLVGIDGTDGAGKSTLADEVAEEIEARGPRCIRASIDSFHRPQRDRYKRGRTSPEGFYLDSHDLAAFRACLLDPVRSGLQFCTAIFDEPSDRRVERTWTDSIAGGAVVVDGLFLHRPELRDAWDLSIWVEAGERIHRERSDRVVADAPSDGAMLLVHLTMWWARIVRYVVSAERYQRDCVPSAATDLVVTNNDLRQPSTS